MQDVHRLRKIVMTVGAVAACLGVVACGPHPREIAAEPSIVGAWLVEIPEAPFPRHLFVFHANGTVEQSNPDAGDAGTSDSNLMGAWETEGDHFKGKVVEITADRATHKLAGQGEMTFTLTVTDDQLKGQMHAMFYDATHRLVRGPIATTLTGKRIRPYGGASHRSITFKKRSVFIRRN